MTQAILSTALLLLASAVGGVACSQYAHEGEVKNQRAQPESKTNQPAQIRFEWIMGARGMKKGTIRVSLSKFRANDGVLVERSQERYYSPAGAQSEMQRIIRQATRIIEAGTKLGFDGRLIGQRAVLIMPASRSQEEKASVVWTDGPELIVLESSSLRHVLEFEKQAYPSVGPATGKPSK